MRLGRIGFKWTPFKVVRGAHLLIVALSVASLVMLGRELYVNFYLPYTFSDEIELPQASGQPLNRQADLTTAVERLEQIRRQPSLDAASVSDVFARPPAPAPAPAPAPQP